MPDSSTESRDTSSDRGAAEVRPSNIRYGVLAFCVAMSVILYLDRMAISVPLTAIAHDLGLSPAEVGDSVAAFFWCYALCQVPAGWLGDRWGGRRALTLYVTAWSLAMGGLAAATGWVSLVVMRALLGIGQAGAYATTASFLRRWMPFERRGFANSAVSLGGRAGGMLAPAVTPVLMAWAAHWTGPGNRWRPAFVVYALVGIAWSILFWWWFRDRPREHRGVNDAEAALIEGGDAGVRETAGQFAGAIPWSQLLRHKSVQLLALIMFSANVGWIFLATWLPTYLMQVHGCTEKEAGLYTSFTAAAGMAGCLVGGVGTDFLLHRVGLRWARRIPGIVSYGGAALGLATVWSLDDVNAIVTMLVVTSFLGDFALGAIWATSQDIGGPLAGTVLGWANMCGNIGAAVAISVIGRMVERYGWSATFVMGASAYLIASLGWLGVDPRRAIQATRVRQAS